MRAILLQKDDYGLQKDRLHGRYGLTGKPTLTQTSIAGSLGTSFKAGQTVTLSNLRSLTAKLKEASLAISGSNANIQDIADNINKTNEASGEATQLLNDNLWQKFWNGNISPQAFYAAKYNEDESNERMLGEPGFPCTNLMSNTFILPRTPCWDYWFEVRNHKTDPSSIRDDDLGFINNEGQLATKIGLSQNLKQISQTVNIVNGVLAGLGVITALTAIALTGSGHGESSVELVISLAATLACVLIVEKLVDKLMTREITELGGKRGKGFEFAGLQQSFTPGSGNYSYSNSVPKCFYHQNWIEITMMDPNVQLLLTSTQQGIITLMSVQAAAAALGTLGVVLVESGVPWLIVAGQALCTACDIGTRYTTSLLKHSTIPTLIIVVSYVLGGICTRSPGYDPKNGLQSFFNFDYLLGALFAQYSKKVRETGYNTELFTSYGTVGQLPLDDTIYDIPGIKQLTQFVMNIQSTITNTIGYAFSWILDEKYTLGNSGFDHDSSEIRIYNYLPFKGTEPVVLSDNYGVDRPSFSWNYNLPNYNTGTIGAGSYIDGPLQMEQTKNGDNYISIKAKIYKGNIYKIKAVAKQNITHTVVLKAHMVSDKNSNGHQWEYFSECALICLDNDIDHLYLHHERNAIYNIGSWIKGASDPIHAEQSFWNFDFKAGVSEKLFRVREGLMNYAYVDFADGVRMQYRYLTDQKNNYLDGELVNTEYKYVDFLDYRYAPTDYNEPGGLQSYGNWKNV